MGASLGDYLDLLLRDHPVDDSIGADFHGALLGAALAGGDEHVVGQGLRRIGDVGA
jgi:hypothetical protein